MKNLVILILILCNFWAFGQKDSVEFIIKKYSFIERISEKSVKTLSIKNTKIDLKFFEEHFSLPKQLPQNLIDPEYKNHTVIIWEFKDEEKDIESNWNWYHTYVYDSFSRIIKYSYSGCISCSNLPYEYKVEYNSKGQITELQNRINFRENYQMRYNKKGNLIKLKYFRSNELQQKIKLK